MEFKIIETYRNHNFSDILKRSIAYVLLFLLGIIIIPTALIASLFKKKSKQPTKEIITEENEWLEFMKSEKLTFFRQAIKDEDLPDDIELPEETYDIYAFKIRTEPEIKEFRNVIFDFKDLETEKGFYLISINRIGKGMSLWNIDKDSNEINIVTKLKSLWWDFSINENKIILKGTEKKKDYIMEIVEM